MGELLHFPVERTRAKYNPVPTRYHVEILYDLERANDVEAYEYMVLDATTRDEAEDEAELLSTQGRWADYTVYAFDPRFDE